MEIRIFCADKSVRATQTRQPPCANLPRMPEKTYLDEAEQFEVRTDYLEKFPVQRAGSSEHLEYWIPADQLNEFNQNIVGKIEVIAEFRGDASNS